MFPEGVSGSCLGLALAVGVKISTSIGMLVVDKIFVTLNGVCETFGKMHLNGVLTGLVIGLTRVWTRLSVTLNNADLLSRINKLAGVDNDLSLFKCCNKVFSTLLAVLSNWVEELLLLVWICGDCPIQVKRSGVCCGEGLTLWISTLGNGVCSTLTCGFCSTLSLFLIRFSTNLYSDFGRIFWMAWELVPRILDATRLTSFTFFDFGSVIVSANSQSSGSLHRKFLVFSFKISLWMDGWTLAMCTDRPDSNLVENLEWEHFIAWPCSSGGFLVQQCFCGLTEREFSLLTPQRHL